MINMMKQSQLLQYLETNFPGGTTDGMSEHFSEKFGVNTRFEDGLVQFKYDMIAVKWAEQLVFECRGHIVGWHDDHWRFVCRPADKFFNQSEGHSNIHTELL